MSRYPQIFRVRQHFERPRVEDIDAKVQSELTRLGLNEKIRPGQSVAVTAGSRGIANIQLITRAIIRHLQALGAVPFIVPAMGSHGGSTAEGQRKVVESYGVSESFCGCPIRSSMETVIVGQAEEGFPIHFDRHAFAADHVLVCGRVKPHTAFAGEIESGLMKMLLIGLGKHEGAKTCHRAFQQYTFDQIVRSAAPRVLRECRIVAGLAIVENGYDETAKIAAVAPQEFFERERELLLLAKSWMPRLPFRDVDLLIIDEMGKDISGSGMDTNVVGRKFNDHAATGGEVPKVRRIAVRSLTASSHGNAIGIGIAEFCTTRLLRQADQQATWINSLASGHISAGMTPLHFETDREILDAALGTIGLVEPHEARLLWIKNTLDLAEVECSAAYLSEARQRSDLEIFTPLRVLPIDTAGNLPESMALGGTGGLHPA